MDHLLPWRILSYEEIEEGGENIFEENLVFTGLKDQHFVRTSFPHCKKALFYRNDKNWICYNLKRRLLPKCEVIYQFSHPCSEYGYSMLADFKKTAFHIPERFAEYYEPILKHSKVDKSFPDSFFVKQVKDMQSAFNSWKGEMRQVCAELLSMPPCQLIPEGGLWYREAKQDFQKHLF